MSSRLLLHLTIFIFLISSLVGANEGVFDKIKAGLKNARNYLETARDIADLVAKSLKSKQTQNKRGDDADFSEEPIKKSIPQQANLISSFFRLLGLDSKKVTAVAVNSFIFFAQMIGELFKLPPKVEHAKTSEENDDPWSPIRMITESQNEKIQNLLQQAQDKNLPDQLVDRAHGQDSPCIRLLLCKTTPIIWAAQKVLKNGSVNGRRAITAWMPSKDEFEDHSDTCDEKHNDCKLNFALETD